MKSIKLFIALFICISALSLAQEKYGKDITIVEKTSISEILSSPEDYLGKKVLVEGEILSVCQMAGCWMEISNENGDKIKIKVKDGEIVFPQKGIGKTALVEGEVYKIELDEEEARDYFEHMAEESDQEFDPSTVTGPVTIYQVKGFGAVIN
jgi:hypothetical protein